MTKKITFGFEFFNFRKDNPDVVHLIHHRLGKMDNLKDVDNNKFRFSQVLDSIFHYFLNEGGARENIRLAKADETLKNYIIPIAVAYGPTDWTDLNYIGFKKPDDPSVFEYLNSKFITDLQNGNAMLMLDQSVEGYHKFWLWEWFHRKCLQYNIDPACIIYFTGDQSCSDSYNKWCIENNQQPRLNVFPSTSLSTWVYQYHFKSGVNTKFEELLEYKKQHSETMFLYDCINKRPRQQRVIFILHLHNSGLLELGNVSMSDKNEWNQIISRQADNVIWVNTELLTKYKLPENIFYDFDDKPRHAKHSQSNEVEHYWDFVERILHDMYKNSWVSVITESSYFENDESVFVSEKTFKPLACMQPFIIVGSKNTLKYLRKLGYKTFHPYIDESYDDLEDADRFIAITNLLKQINAIEDKAAWYESMRDILEHNYKLFLTITHRESDEYQAIKKCYLDYFKDSNV
jgi:hypothetical protein